MRQSNYKLNENVEDVIQSLQLRIASLQNQYIAFVSYCTDLVKSHKKSLLRDLSNLSNSKTVGQIVSKSLESLEENYKNATSGMGFNVTTKNLQSALEESQKNILNLYRLNISAVECEKRVAGVFSMLSEIMYRKLIKFNKKEQEKAKSPRVSSNESIRSRGKMAIAVPKDIKEKITSLECRIVELTSIIESKDKEIGYLTQSTDSPYTQKSSPNSKERFLSTDPSKANSIATSPISSPILGEKKRTAYSKLKSSGEAGFSMERFRGKLENLASLLEKFNGFLAQLEENIYNNPELEMVATKFKSVKRELSNALMEIIHPRKMGKMKSEDSDVDKSLGNEILMLKSENCKLKAEANERSEELNEANDKTWRVEQENAELRKKSSENKKDVLKMEKEKEEIRLENVYLKSQIERLAKNNKVLQESLASSESKVKDFTLLHSKYEQILFSNKIKAGPILSLSFLENITIQPLKFLRPKRLIRGIFDISHEKGVFIESNSGVLRASKLNPYIFMKQDQENLTLLNKKLENQAVLNKKLEEELEISKESIRELEEKNKNSMDRLLEAMEMCKIFEELLNKSEESKVSRTCKNLRMQNFEAISCNSSFSTENMQQLLENSVAFPKILQELQLTREKLSKIEQALKKKSDDYELLQEQHKILVVHIENYEEESEKLMKSNTSLKKTQLDLQEKLKFLHESNTSLSSQLSEKAKLCAELSQSLSKLSIPSFPALNSSSRTQLISLFSSISNLISTSQTAISSKCSIELSRISSLSTQLFSLRSQVSELNQLKNENTELKNEMKKMESERKKLLETRDKLIIQCNSQSDEIISLKMDQEEKVLQKIEDADYQIAMLQGQVKKLESAEETLTVSLNDLAGKNKHLLQEKEEKERKIEELHEELGQLKFKLSTISSESGESYKEEIYNLKMKNIKLEQIIKDIKNAELSNDELSSVKNLYQSQLSKIDEERMALERKLKEKESSWQREKESLQKSLDSFTKQLAGANLEMHELKERIKSLNMKLSPEFQEPSDYKVLKAVDYGLKTWYLLEDAGSKELLWVDALPFENEEEVKDPVPILLKERSSLQKLNSELCIENHRLKTLFSKIESFARKESLSFIISLLHEGKNLEKQSFLEPVIRNQSKKQNSLSSFYVKSRRGPSNILETSDRKTMSEVQDQDAFSIDSVKSLDTGAFQQILADKEEELYKKNDFIKKQEANLFMLKEQNSKMGKELERFEHLKVLIAKLQLLNPNLNNECTGILNRIVLVSGINNNKYMR